MSITIRDARDADGPRLMRLIESCFDEFPGCVLDVEREMPELRAIASSFGRDGGRFWVAEQGDRLVGCVGAVPVAGGALELRKLYVAAATRRSGVGQRLSRLVIDEARQRGASRLELWSDTRFLDAHRLYRRVGFERGNAVRALGDLSDSYERQFTMRLAAASDRPMTRE